MGHNAHRFSIEWSRIEPRPGEIDREAVAHYRDVLETLRRDGMTPLVTLHHFTSPKWFADAGGFEEPFSVETFEAFVKLCVREYGDIVDTWTTFNEPNVYTYYSYLLGEWPPQKRDIGAAIKVFRNMVRAHARAYAAIHAGPNGGRATVGVAQHLRVFEPWHRWSPLDRVAALIPEAAFNHWFLRACTDGWTGFPLGTRERVPEAAGTLDHVGVNYYSRDMVAFSPTSPNSLFSRQFTRPGGEVSEFKMEIYAEGMRRVLRDTWARYHKPIYVTEHGVADRTDQWRRRVIVGHLAEMALAERGGVDVRGYLHWSSMDNFEWSEGYSMAFGLIEIDFATQERKPRPSAALYSEIIRRNGLLWSELQDLHPRGLRYFVGSTSRDSSSRSPS
jgi:beta-glucosidase